MRRTLLALVAGMVLGVVLTFAAVAMAGGWWEYAILPDGRCHPTGGNSVLVAEPVPHASNPCAVRYPRWTLIN